MIRQYHAHCRRQGGDNPYGVGVISIGSIYYLQDDYYWRDRFRGSPTCRNPWIVEAFLNGTLGAARRNPTSGKWESCFISGRSDMAILRSLRNGRRRTVAEGRVSAFEPRNPTVDYPFKQPPERANVGQ